jgi:signal transduction histidine kinase
VGQSSFTPGDGDGSAVVGRFAALLAEGRPLLEGLHLLAGGLGLRNVVVRGVDGELLGVGGEALQLMSALPANEAALEFPVPGPQGTPIASLTVRGGRPSQLPALRAAAAVLSLALAGRAAASAPALVEGRERDLDELADTLHDGPMQSLMVARYAVDAAARGGDLGTVRGSLQDAVVELRRLIWNLRPRGESDLVAALGQLSATRVKDGLSPIEVEVPSHGLEIDPAAAVLAYRLVQAAAPNRVRLTLQPDGVGVEINSGLPSSQRWLRRAEALGCRLTADAEHCRLLLPSAARPSSNEVRTTS